MSALINLMGKRYGDFIVITRDYSSDKKDPYWLLQCVKCLRQKSVNGSTIRDGRAAKECKECKTWK